MTGFKNYALYFLSTKGEKSWFMYAGNINNLPQIFLVLLITLLLIILITSKSL